MGKLLLLALAFSSCARFSSQDLDPDKHHPKEPLACVEAKELVDRLYVDNTQQSKAVVRRQTIQTEANKLYFVNIQVELSNDLGFTVGVGSYLSTNGVNVMHPTMSNITSDQHHDVFQLVAVVNGTGEPVTFEYTMYVVSYSQQPGDYIIVEPCYSYMEITKLN